jgi:predicted TPR repeat methyltransferase
MDEKHEQTNQAQLTLEQAITLGIKLQQSGHPSDAEKVYQAVLEAFPDHPDALHFLGLTRFALNHDAEAIELITRALELSPEYVDAWINLGNIQLHQGAFAAAEQAYHRALDLRPENPMAWNNLGLALKGMNRWEEAVDALTRAVSQAPDSPEFCYNLGNASCAGGDFSQGALAFRKAIGLRPYESALYQNLCRTLYILKDDRGAEEVVKQWIERDPDNPTAQHLLAAYTREAVPQRASDSYVQHTFDCFAEFFEEVLGRLDYQAPQQVAEAFATEVGEARHNLEILDAGCGTGLVGPLLRSYASRLIGVDLSGKMLRLAADRRVYDELLQAELTAFISANTNHYDAIISADTLVYFGALEDVTQAAFNALRPGGILVFSVEEATDETIHNYSIAIHGRYQHATEYIRQILQDTGFEVRRIKNTVLRQESGEPVRGLVTTAVKSL